MTDGIKFTIADYKDRLKQVLRIIEHASSHLISNQELGDAVGVTKSAIGYILSNSAYKDGLPYVPSRDLHNRIMRYIIDQAKDLGKLGMVKIHTRVIEEDFQLLERAQDKAKEVASENRKRGRPPRFGGKFVRDYLESSNNEGRAR